VPAIQLNVAVPQQYLGAGEEPVQAPVPAVQLNVAVLQQYLGAGEEPVQAPVPAVQLNVAVQQQYYQVLDLGAGEETVQQQKPEGYLTLQFAAAKHLCPNSAMVKAQKHHAQGSSWQGLHL
jgi:hypothetical protein